MEYVDYLIFIELLCFKVLLSVFFFCIFLHNGYGGFRVNFGAVANGVFFSSFFLLSP